jgi:phosphopantetheinyl transferase
MDLPLDAFDIVAEPTGAPVVRLADGGRLPVGVSISHSVGTAFCAAWAESGGVLAVGADLERIAPRPEGLVRDFFRPAEISAWEALPPGSARDGFASAVWSAKEAVLKALRLGLSVDTSVEISCREDAAGATDFRARMRRLKGFAACCAPGLPGALPRSPVSGERRTAS